MPLQEDFEKQGLYLFRYRSMQPIVLLLIGAAFYLWSQAHPKGYLIKMPLSEFYFEITCLLVSILGLLIRIYTVGHTPKNTSGRNTDEQVADVVNTTGSYSLVRHPLYVGNFFMWLGPALLTANWWFVLVFCLFYWLYYERIMYAEEQYLRKKFGQAYLDWAMKVPAFFPSFKNFKSPCLPFSWKKVIKREKNGLAAAFVIFCAFDIAGEYIQGTTQFNGVLVIGAGVSVVFYGVVTLIRKTSNLLHEEGR